MTRLDLNIRMELSDFKLEISDRISVRGLTALFGPSGAGKSTLLRIIAGFERGTGTVTFDGESWEDAPHFTPPHRRRVATVFQQPRLFPHLDVAGNLSYAAQRANTMREVEPLVKRFDLTPILRRRTEALSGGEASRVSLARALLTAPRLILMDEPLAALDHKRRSEILPYIEWLRDDAEIPILYVSHSVAEVARLASKVVALQDGRIAGIGPTAEIMSDTLFEPVLGADDPGSLVPAEVVGRTDDGLCELRFAGGAILTPENLGEPGAPVRILIRARDVIIARTRPEGLSALNILPARVESLSSSGTSAMDVALSCGGVSVRARITRRSAANLALEPGTECFAILKTVALTRD